MLGNETLLIDQPNDSSTMHVVIKVIEGVMYPGLNLPPDTSHHIKESEVNPTVDGK